MTASIKPFLPFKVVYLEEFQTREEALEREKYFKSSAGIRFLKNKLASPFPARLPPSGVDPGLDQQTTF
jgi:hypothetical protein